MIIFVIVKILLLTACCSLIASQITVENSFATIVEKAAGYYTDETKSKENNLMKTIIVTASNFAYLSHLQNFKCFMDRLGLKFMVLSMDAHTHHYMSSRDMISYHFAHMHTSVDNSTVGEAMTGFRSKGFNHISRNKKRGVSDILELGYNVLFSDGDVAVIRDPIQYLQYANVDYIHSVNVLCPYIKFNYGAYDHEGNTGFYFIKSSPASIKIMRDAAKTFLIHPHLDDQVVFWRHFIKNVKDPLVQMLNPCRNITLKEIQDYQAGRGYNESSDVFVMCPLDECSFSAGTIHRYDKRIEMIDRRPNDFAFVTIHANYILGSDKQHMMKTRGLWLATKGTKVSNDTFVKASGTSSSSSEEYFWDGVCAPLIDHSFDKWPLPFEDKSTIKLPGAREVYYIVNNTKCLINDMSTFQKLGLDFDDTATVNHYEFTSIPTCSEGSITL